MNFIKNSFTYDDLLLEPRLFNGKSRKEIDLSTEICGNKLKTPIIAAPMDTVVDPYVLLTMSENGGMGIIHRFCDYQKILKQLAWEGIYRMMPVGLISEQEVLEQVNNVKPEGLLIEVAHAHQTTVLKLARFIKDEFPNIPLMVGNIASTRAALDFAEIGVDAVKIGVGPGCFAAGTRILMANGIYKNIEEVTAGDRVINKDGKPVSVKHAFSTGIRKVIKYRTNVGIGSTICTPDHRHFIGDLSTTSKETVASSGYKKQLDKLSNTTPRKSKYMWKSISETAGGQAVCLMPRNIDFEMPESFKISLKKRTGGNWRTGNEYKVYQTLEPSWELGYIFGTFLGDGTSHLNINKKNNSHSGSISWYFNITEKDIADKLSNCIEIVFSRKTFISTPKGKNLIKVSFYDKPFAEFLSSFGKRQDKHLPSDLLCNNIDYVKGLYEGLVDSDGHICIENEKERVSFTNTSKNLLELFGILTYKLTGHFPNINKKDATIGAFLNTNIDNYKDAWRSTLLIAPQNRLTENFQVVKLIEYEDLMIEQEVFDLEIDDDTHSFIANNVIVHNSACSTRSVTGCGVPQAFAVAEIYGALARNWKYTYNMPQIVADGGIKSSGDIVKALALGADAVMIGSLLAQAKDGPGETIEIDGITYKTYRGMASEDVMKNRGIKRAAEGVTSKVKVTKTLSEIMSDLTDGIQSGLSYLGFNSLQELKANRDSIFAHIITNGARAENTTI